MLEDTHLHYLSKRRIIFLAPQIIIYINETPLLEIFFSEGITICDVYESFYNTLHLQEQEEEGEGSSRPGDRGDETGSLENHKISCYVMRKEWMGAVVAEKESGRTR